MRSKKVDLILAFRAAVRARRDGVRLITVTHKETTMPKPNKREFRRLAAKFYRGETLTKPQLRRFFWLLAIFGNASREEIAA